LEILLALVEDPLIAFQYLIEIFDGLSRVLWVITQSFCVLLNAKADVDVLYVDEALNRNVQN
jgi:hypothetical protein